MRQNESTLKEYRLQKEIEQLRKLVFIQKKEELKGKLSKVEKELKSVTNGDKESQKTKLKPWFDFKNKDR